MPTVQEKLAGNKPAVPIEIMETDHENITLTRDQFEAKYRKKKEIKAKLAAEKIRLEEEALAEQEALEKIGAEDNKKTKKSKKIVEETMEEV